jgi:uncharacterized C2H2 Zn-finger protein
MTTTGDLATCPRCAIKKPRSDFPRHAAKASGHATYCRPCSAEMTRAYRQTEAGQRTHRDGNRRWVERTRARNLALRESSGIA